MLKSRAAILLRKLIDRDLSRDEYEEFLEGMNNRSGRDAYSQYLETVFQNLTGDKLLDPGIRRFITPEAARLMRMLKKNSHTKKRPLRVWIGGIAATLSLIVFSYLAHHNLTWFQESVVQPTTSPAPSIQLPVFQSVTPRGKKGTVNLTDGSRVYLNAASRVSLDAEYNLTNRKLSLDGEAFFDVRHDRNKPFVISTDEMEIEVVGTSFNVKAYSEDPTYTLTVSSGKVNVILPRIDARRSNKIELQQYQKLIYTPSSGVLEVKKVQPGKDISWKNGALSFEKTPIREVERILERWYDVDLIIKDYSIYDKALTGVHRNESLKSVMEALTYATGTRYEVKDNCIIIKKGSI